MSSTILLRIRAAQENERGPLYMEPAIAALHSLRGEEVGLEIGLSREGKISLYVRASANAVHLIESQLYAQYPEIDIEEIPEDPFAASDAETVISADLTLADPEVLPIKRHPQFDDLLARVNVDSVAGITSALARYPAPGMRGHVQIVFTPLSNRFRKRALRVLPFLHSGLAKISKSYENFFADVTLARGWRRAALFPFFLLIGGWRTWPFFGRFFTPAALGERVKSELLEDQDAERVSARSHDREDAVAGAVDKLNRLLFLCNVRVSVIAPKPRMADARQKIREIVGSFSQFSLPQSNEFKARGERDSAQIPFGFTGRPYVLSVEEIATLWHLPTLLVQTPNVDWVLSRKLEPPVNLPVPEITDPAGTLTILGEAVYRGRAETAMQNASLAAKEAFAAVRDSPG